MYSKCTDIYWHLGLSYKASVSILDSAKCVTACLLMIQGPAASALTLNLKKPFGVFAKNTKDGFEIKTVCKTHYSPSLKA